MSTKTLYTQEQLRQWANEWIRQQPEHKLSSVDGIDPEILDGFARFAQHVLNREEVSDRLIKAGKALHAAMLLYQLDVDEDPPYQHRAMMQEWEEALAAKVEPRDQPQEGEGPWIPVSEMPELKVNFSNGTKGSERVHLYLSDAHEDNRIIITEFRVYPDGTSHWVGTSGYKPTHWMPLPTPPPTPS